MAASPGRGKSGDERRQGIQSIEVGSRLLDVLAHAGGPLGLGELSSGAQMTASKAHRYLVSLLRCGLVQQEPVSGRYDLGPMALKMGLASLNRLKLVRYATEAIIDLNQRFDLTAMLVVWGSQGPTIIGMYNSTAQSITNVNVGSVLPLLRSASGRVFLAYLPRPLTRSWVKQDLKGAPNVPDRQMASMVAVDTMIADVRRRGVGATHGDIILGESAVAAPVFDHEGRIAACLTLLGLSGAIEANGTDGPTEALLLAARNVSERIGFWNATPGHSFAEWLDVLREAPRVGDAERPLPPALLNPGTAPLEPPAKRRRPSTRNAASPA